MPLNPKECKVALLSGGTSGERDISIASGDGAQGALEAAGFQVTRLDPAEQADLKRLLDERFDVAFLTLHGKGGEDGTIQGMLDLLGVPYTGSGVLASATAMDKGHSKIVYADAGIPIIPGVALKKGDPVELDAIEEVVGSHCVVKPATEGSSLGIRIVQDSAELAEAIDYVFSIDDKIVIEKFVTGTETTVAVLGNERLEALPVIEIVPLAADTYDFESKYAPGGCEHIIPARLDDGISARLQDLAKQAHLALGCRGVSRTDFIVDENGDPWILETNTIPGMTATSLLPDTADVAGYTFPELCTKLVEFALEQG